MCWATTIDCTPDSKAVERLVEVYECDGSFIFNFVVGKGDLFESDITAGNENNVLVLKKHCVQVYTFLGVFLCEWSTDFVDTMNFSDCLFCQRFHSADEHVFIAQNYNTNTKKYDDLFFLRSEVQNFPFYVSIYTKEGEFVCSIQLQSSPKLSLICHNRDNSNHKGAYRHSPLRFWRRIRRRSCVLRNNDNEQARMTSPMCVCHCIYVREARGTL